MPGSKGTLPDGPVCHHRDAGGRGDLAELRSYIAEVLQAPGTALSYLGTLEKEIMSLSELPARYKLMEEEPWRSRGFRRLAVRRFYVYYRIDEAERRVYVTNVIYTRRDQLRALKEENSE